MAIRFRGLRRVLGRVHNDLLFRWEWYERWHAHPRRHIHHRRIAFGAGLTGLATIAISATKYVVVLSLLSSLSFTPNAALAAAQTWTSQSDWGAWTLSNTTSADNPGSVQLATTGAGASWHYESGAPSVSSYTSAFAADDTHAWFGVYDQTYLIFHNGSGYSQQGSLGQPSSKAMWGSSASDVWSFSGIAMSGSFHYNGSSWSSGGTLTEDVHDMSGTASNDIWAAASNGTIYHYNGSSWSGSVITGVPLNFVTAFATNDAFAAGSTSLFFHWNGSAWSGVTAPSGEVTGMWGTSSSDAWVRSSDNNLYHTTNGASSWTTDTSPTTNSCTANGSVWGTSASDIWTTCKAGAVLHYNGSSWSSVATPGAEIANRITGSSSTNVWATAGAYLFHYYGSTVYQTSGTATITYTPSAGQKNDWTTASPTTNTPTNTSVTLEYSHDNSTWVSSLASVPSSESLYVKGTLTTTDTSVTPTLDALTVNYDAITTTVSSPNGGETILFNETGDTQTVSWTAAGTAGVDHIHLQYSTNSGSSWTDISGATALPADTISYDWNMPDASSSTVRIKVILENSSNAELASDTSNSNFTLTYDPNAPVLSVTTTSNNPTNTIAKSGDVITVAITSDESLGATPVVHIDSIVAVCSGSGTSWSCTHTVTDGDPEGLLTVNISASDALGNIRGDSSTSITIDHTTPTIVISSPTSSPTYSTTSDSLALSGTSSDTTGVASVTSSVAGSVTGTTSWSQTVNLSLGDTVVTYTAHDTAGNTATDAITVTRTSADPTISITSPTADSTYATTQTSFTISGTATATGATVTAVTSSASGTVTGTTSWSQTVTLSAGTTAITYTVTDSNATTSTDTITITVDPTAPTITISSPYSTASTYYTKEGTITLSGTASDDSGISAVTSSAAGTVTGTTSWSQTISVVSGQNTVTYTAHDAFGNTGGIVVTIYRDTVAPTIHITSPTSGDTYTTDQPSIVIAGTGADNIQNPDITSSYGGTVSGSESWSQTVSLTVGENRITYTATDRVGNTATDTIVITYTPPAAPTIVTPPAPVRNLQIYSGYSNVVVTYSPVPIGHVVTIWRSTDSTQRGTQLTSGINTQYIDQDISPGTTYYYTLIVTRDSDAAVSLPATISAEIPSKYGLAISISPLVVSIKPGAMKQLSAIVYDTRGNKVTAPITWTTSPGAGTITPTGLFTAAAIPGDFRQSVRATVDYQGVQGSATSDVYIDPTDDILTYLYITPTSATLKPGEQLSARISARNQNGASYTIDPKGVTWKSTGGTITSAGIYTAGTKEATYTEGISALYIDAQGHKWNVTAPITVSSEPRRLTFATMSGTLRIPVGSIARYYAYGYDQFSNIMPTQQHLFTNSNPDAGGIDAIGNFHADNKESCFFYNLRTDQVAGDMRAYARSGVNTLRYTDTDTAKLDAAVGLSFRQYRWLQKPGSEFSFIAYVVDGWGRMRPHTAVRYKMLDARAGTITENGYFVAGSTNGIYPASLGVYIVDTSTDTERLYGRYNLIISNEEPRLTRLVTPSVATAPNLAGQTVVYAYDQFGLTYSAPLVRRYNLLSGTSTILQNGLIETTTPETLRNTIFGSVNAGGFTTLTKDQGNLTVSAQTAPRCGTSTGNGTVINDEIPPDYNPGGGGNIDDGGAPLYFITPENSVLPDSPADTLEPIIPKDGHVPTLDTPTGALTILAPLSPLGRWITQHVPWIQNLVLPLSALAIIASIPALAVGLFDLFSQLFNQLLGGLINMLQTLTIYRRPRTVGKVVKGKSGTPVAGATVQLLSPGTRRVIDTQHTDQDGQYICLVDQHQAYLLRITADGFEPFERTMRGYALHRIVRLGLRLEDDLGRLIQRQRWEAVLTVITRSRIILLIIGTLAWLSVLSTVGPTGQSYGLGVYYLFAWLLEGYISILPRPYGVVRDATTNTPLSQVVVRVLNPAGRIVATEITNQRGQFKLLLQRGIYHFSYSKHGYNPTSQQGVILQRGVRATRVDAKLHSAQTY